MLLEIANIDLSIVYLRFLTSNKMYLNTQKNVMRLNTFLLF